MKPYFRRLWAAIRGRDAEAEDVRRFHQKFGLLNYPRPGHLTQRKLQERVDCMAEELAEFQSAIQTQSLEDQLDALIDLVYFAKGTAVMLGFHWAVHWDEVQRANMAKVRGATKRGHRVDVTKPQGWEPPAHGRLLWERGYERSFWTFGGLPRGVVHEGKCRDDQ